MSACALPSPRSLQPCEACTEQQLPLSRRGAALLTARGAVYSRGAARFLPCSRLALRLLCARKAQALFLLRRASLAVDGAIGSVASGSHFGGFLWILLADAVTPPARVTLSQFNTVMTLASPWYDNASLWSGVSAIAAVVMIGIGAWATLRATNPRRRLSYEVHSLTPVVPATGPLREHVSVSAGGIILTDPHVFSVELANTGWRDIPSSAFDRGIPIRLDLGAQVISVLETVMQPPHALTPVVAVDGQSLLLGPSLIAKKQSVKISALVNGVDPALSIRTGLTDVKVESAEVLHSRERRAENWAPVIAPIALLGIIQLLPAEHWPTWTGIPLVIGILTLAHFAGRAAARLIRLF